MKNIVVIIIGIFIQCDKVLNLYCVLNIILLLGPMIKEKCIMAQNIEPNKNQNKVENGSIVASSAC